ncbi:MAG: hypothetical protein KC589_09850 [Nanoarchaeota archaeon]|nr:hypothetical protein [Nanoarchaeota archaeon]
MKKINTNLLWLSDKEKDEINDLWYQCQTELDIGERRKSEIFAQGIINHLTNLLQSYIPHTHTKSQSLSKQRRECTYDLVKNIKEKGYMAYSEAFSSLIYMNDCFKDVKARAISSHFQNFLISEDFVFIYINNFHETHTVRPIYLIHKQSKWYAQLKDLCFNIKNPVLKITHDNYTNPKLLNVIFERLKRKATFKNLDKAEKTILMNFLYEIKEIDDKPFSDNTDLIMMEMIQLRSEFRFAEATNLIKLQNNLSVETGVEQFLESLGK